MKPLTDKKIREIKRNLDITNWYSLSCNYKLSETFMREFQNKIKWDYISWRQEMSEDFILEFYNKLNWRYLNVLEKVNRKTFEKMNGEQKLYMIMNYRDVWSRVKKNNK